MRDRGQMKGWETFFLHQVVIAARGAFHAPNQLSVNINASMVGDGICNIAGMSRSRGRVVAAIGIYGHKI